jgi:hypothetical protein
VGQRAPATLGVVRTGTRCRWPSAVDQPDHQLLWTQLCIRQQLLGTRLTREKPPVRIQGTRGSDCSTSRSAFSRLQGSKDDMRPSKQLGDRRGNVWEPFRVNHGRGRRPDNTHERRQAQGFDQFDFQVVVVDLG